MFELDDIPVPDLSPFKYTATLVTGETITLPLKPEDFPDLPQKPATPKHLAERGTDEWYDWATWERYQGMVAYQSELMQRKNAYLNKVKEYILSNCIQPDDRFKIHSIVDWDRVQTSALVEMVTMEMIEQSLRSTFSAEWDGQEILQALSQIRGGQGKYDAVRKWELDLMNYMGLMEIQYLAMPVKERARRIVAFNLDKWIDTLDANKRLKEMEMKNAAAGV